MRQVESASPANARNDFITLAPLLSHGGALSAGPGLLAGKFLLGRSRASRHTLEQRWTYLGAATLNALSRYQPQPIRRSCAAMSRKIAR